MKASLLKAILGALLGAGIVFAIGNTRSPSPAPPVQPVEVAPAAQTEAQPKPAIPSNDPLLWASVESADFAQLAANLRDVGCPEQTIKDIVSARITFAYRERIRKLENPMLKYWATAEELKAHEKNVSAIVAERDALLTSLGIALAPNPFAEVKPPSTTLQLSPEKQQHIADITAKFPNQLLSMTATKEEVDQFFNNRRARLDYLSQILTPEELRTYRLEKDSSAKTLASIMRPLNLTEEEFSKIAFVMDFSEFKMVNGQFPPEIEKALREGLGEQRYAEYREAYAPGNASLSRFVMQDHTSPEEISQLRAIRQQNLPPDALKDALTKLLGPQRAMRYLNMTRGPGGFGN